MAFLPTILISRYCLMQWHPRKRKISSEVMNDLSMLYALEVSRVWMSVRGVSVYTLAVIKLVRYLTWYLCILSSTIGDVTLSLMCGRESRKIRLMTLKISP